MSSRQRWLVVGLVVALVVAGAALGSLWLLGGSTPTSATVAVTTACVRVQGISCARSSAQVASCPVVTTPLGAMGLVSLAMVSGLGLLARSRRRRERRASAGVREVVA